MAARGWTGILASRRILVRLAQPWRRRALAAMLGAFVAISVGGCVHRFWRTTVRAVDRPGASDETVVIQSPLKAHLIDGSTVLFRGGASIDHTEIRGAGVRYALLSSDGSRRDQVPLDSVLGVETFEGKLLTAPTVVVSTAATALAVVATVGLLKAIFGSCPTVYADTGSGPVLEAEGFSYAIAPLLEQRDLATLRVRPDGRGIIRLELRNEALETHFINNVEVVAVSHAAGSRAMPDQSGHVVLVDGVRPLSAARDRQGRDVRDVLAAADGKLFVTAPATIDAAHVSDLEDWIDLEARDLPAGDSIAVVLRLRNSLLNTVLLYDGMLNGRDAPEWLETGLQHIASAIDMAKWYGRTMGMRAVVDGVPFARRDEPWHARFGDVGPIAFRDVAIVLPRPSRTSRDVRIRLRFVADGWRIDYAAVAPRISRPAFTILPVQRALIHSQRDSTALINDTAAVTALDEPDRRYLQTLPGQRMWLEFAAPVTMRPDTTTYLIAWQGWYREWIRGRWLAEPMRRAPWVPGDEAVLAALREWRGTQEQFERTFYSTKVPVR